MSSSQEYHEIRCQPTKIMKISVANANLGLDVHSSSPKPVNFFGAQSSLGGTIFVWGAQAAIWGGRAPECPPVAPGLVFCISSRTYSAEVGTRYFKSIDGTFAVTLLKKYRRYFIRYIFEKVPTVPAVADPENFGGGDLKPKPQKFGCLHQN